MKDKKQITTKRKTLPATPSKLIRLAMADLYVMEQSPNYQIHMGEWHSPQYVDRGKGICNVCLAGAVIANTLGCNRLTLIDPDRFTSKIEGKLRALDYFRMGSVGAGFQCMRRSFDKGMKFDRDIENYDTDPLLFKRQMRQLARTLEANNL